MCLRPGQHLIPCHDSKSLTISPRKPHAVIEVSTLVTMKVNPSSVSTFTCLPPQTEASRASHMLGWLCYTAFVAEGDSDVVPIIAYRGTSLKRAAPHPLSTMLWRLCLRIFTSAETNSSLLDHNHLILVLVISSCFSHIFQSPIGRGSCQTHVQYLIICNARL